MAQKTIAVSVVLDIDGEPVPGYPWRRVFASAAQDERVVVLAANGSTFGTMASMPRMEFVQCIGPNAVDVFATTNTTVAWTQRLKPGGFMLLAGRRGDPNTGAFFLVKNTSATTSTTVYLLSVGHQAVTD